MVNIPTVSVDDHELSDPAWWLQYHKGNVLYLCIRIKKFIENPEDEDTASFFKTHFETVLPAFIDSVSGNSSEH